MQAFLLGLITLAAVIWALSKFTSANPAEVIRKVNTAALVTTRFISVLISSRIGRVFALPFILISSILFMLGRWLSSTPRARTTAGRSSEVTTDHLIMRIDLDTGAIKGRVIKGMFKDRTIESLKPVELAHLWTDCRFADPQSALMLEAYLDRVHPGWREDMERGEEEMKTSPGGKLKREEALDILGLKAGASEDDIRHAHRELMKKVHPDRGGSTYLAAKVNEAKDILLGGG